MALPAGDRVAYAFPEQAAEAAGVSVHSIISAVRDGRLAARQAGASKVILRADLEKFAATLPAARKDTPRPSAAEVEAAKARGRAIVERHLGKRTT